MSSFPDPGRFIADSLTRVPQLPPRAVVLVLSEVRLAGLDPTVATDEVLEPFRSLEVEALLAHADDSLVKAFMADVFADNPWVRTDPLAVTR
ncbi:hypothetical protein [Nocardia sp. NBC_01377]|uniref:hypothetical protein n=1 Tax=Nocardia sp. NBC_01377 TaxID=2903595 RepID=UPI0038632BBA